MMTWLKNKPWNKNWDSWNKLLQIRRSFERNFPWIAADEREYNNNLLAWWRTLAEQWRKSRQTNIAKTLSDIPTLDKILKTVCLLKLNQKTKKEETYTPEKDDSWETIINHKEKTINFINEESWEIITKKFK